MKRGKNLFIFVLSVWLLMAYTSVTIHADEHHRSMITPVLAAGERYMCGFKGQTVEIAEEKNIPGKPELSSPMTPNEPPSAIFSPTATEEIGIKEAPALPAQETIIQVAAENGWALLNLLSVFVTIVIAVFMIISFLREKEEIEELHEEYDEEDNIYEEYRFERNRLLGIVPAAVSLVSFFFTQDLRKPMTLADRYTAMMFIIMFSNIVLAALTRKRKKKQKEDLKLNKA